MRPEFKLISAGAGSGKTYRLTEELKSILSSGKVEPAGIIATTFTVRAADELQERVRQALIADGQPEKANEMGQASIGTVNGACGELLKRFAFEAGMSPQQKVVDEDEGSRLFAQALETCLEEDLSLIQKMNAVSNRLGIIDDKRASLWREEVKQVVAAARANNVAQDEFIEFAHQSISSLMSFFSKPTKRDLSDELKKAIKKALDSFDPEVDKTKGSATYFQNLKGSLVSLDRNRMSWPDWIKLSKSAPTKKSLVLAEPIQLIAADYSRHPELHDDICFFIEQVFSIAAKSLEVFQSIKSKLGLVDFVDQEHLLLNLLDNEIVKECLKDELQLLMVDEFQDTSPIQLAVFVKLSKLADQVIWVGDIKQSIYGFRGSDPELMQAVIRYLEDDGSKAEVLGHSWRSRPALVKYINNLFVPAFSNTIPSEQVQLSPARTETEGSVVEFWSLCGSNKSSRAMALANEVKILVESRERKVVDKENNKERELVYGDIAILCRTHTNLAEVADALSKYDIPVNHKRPGVMGSPEGALAFACLRRVADPQDTLASAEIRALTLCECPEVWLVDRLNYLNEGNKASEWGEDNFAPLMALAEERTRLSYLTPREVMEQVLLVADVRATVIRWSRSEFEASQRLRNIDAFLTFADEYIEHCDAQSTAATVSGLILWLMQLADSEQDWYASATGNAISLVTHHGAKGLEWPVAFAMDLESKIKSRIWGLSVQATEGEFQWSSPLDGRKLKYWPSFFGKQSTGVLVKDGIENSEIGAVARSKAEEETKRLLYVSLTRPRDLLVLPFPEKATTGEWIQTLDADWMLPEGNTLELPDGEIIPTAFKEVESVDVELTGTIPAMYWPERFTQSNSPKFPAKIAPSSAKPMLTARVDRVETIAERINLAGNPDVTKLGLALHAIIATEVINRDISIARVKVTLGEYGLINAIKAEDALCCATNFIEQVEGLFKPKGWHVEQPINVINEVGQKSKGWIDLLLETDEGWVIIDHKASPMSRGDWEKNALKYSGQLDIYGQALRQAGEKVAGYWIHFAITGGLVSIMP